MKLQHLFLASAVVISSISLGVSAQTAQVTTNDKQATASKNSSVPKVVLLSALQYLTKGSTADLPAKGEAEKLAALRLEISENALYQSVLKAAGFAAEDVIAISTDQSGVPLLFVDDL
jgi:hypothetical protein